MTLSLVVDQAKALGVDPGLVVGFLTCRVSLYISYSGFGVVVFSFLRTRISYLTGAAPADLPPDFVQRSTTSPDLESLTS